MNLFKTKFDAATIVLIPACIGINYLGKMFASLLKLPLWLDSIGTCIGGCLGGPIIGGICGAANNLIYGLTAGDNITLIYALTSLGIGLAAAQGMALGLKLNHSDARVYAVLGDGELDEGAVWEAAASAVKFGLDNLTAIVDWNKVQLDGTTDEIMPLRDLPGKWKAFGWNVLRCDGHDLTALDAALDAAAACKGVPTVILADTVKGKGVSFMEGKAAWHGKAIPDAEFAQAMQELGGNV